MSCARPHPDWAVGRRLALALLAQLSDEVAVVKNPATVEST
jgi:hypothetical protein